jgi:hypothetical protein
MIAAAPVLCPLERTAERLDMIKSAIQAPSSHNSQPWKFVLDEDTIRIYPDYTRRLPVVDPDNRELFISLGCALENLLLAARCYGYDPELRMFPAGDPECLQVSLGPKVLPENFSDILTMVKRQTSHAAFDARKVPAEDLNTLQRIPLEPEVSLQTYISPRYMEKLVRLTREANEWQLNDKSFREELAGWIRFSESAITQRADGLAAPLLGLPALPDWLGKILLKYWASDKDQSDRDARCIRSSSALLIIASAGNDKRSWVNVGRSFERIALRLTTLGIQYAHVNQVCEVPHIRAELREYMYLTKQYPQLVLRLGYAPRLPYSRRRPVEEVLQHAHLADQIR